MIKHRRTSYDKGLWAEWLARLSLRLKGYRIVAQRYKTPFGEIDIVARRGNILAFIEVKYRPAYEDAAYAITPKAQQRISRAAAAFVSAHPDVTDLDMRFDAILISPPLSLRHLDNVWLCSP